MKLHIINNEKITQRTISVFEKVFPFDNKFIVLDTVMDRFDTSIYNSEIVFVSPKNKKEFWNAIGDITSYQHVIIHFLSYEVINLLGNVSHPSIFWVEWGADLYINMLHPRGFRLYEDPKYVMRVLMPKIPSSIVNFLYFLRRKKYQLRYKKFVYKVKYFVPDSMPGEYDLLLSYYPEYTQLVYRGFFYYPIDIIIPDKSLVSKGNNIMINHCATLTGNHLGVIEQLGKLNLKDKEIVIPVSYGNITHAQNVEREAKEKFGDRIKMIKDFMPLADYNRVLEGCDVFIYGHFRQEAVGNILIALYLGGKVYLHECNPLLAFYKSIGLSIFSIEKDLSTESINTKLTEETIFLNKKIIEDYYSETRLLELTKDSFK